MAAPAVIGARAAARRPNILLITADDLGLNLSCYGEKRFRTPHIDKLAASCVQFRTAYITQASCSPSRSSIFTGVYPHGTGQYGLANTGFSLHPQLRTATIPALLQKAGYRTSIIGKLHVEPEDCFPWDTPRKGGPDMRRVRDVARHAAGVFEKFGNEPFFLMVNYSDPHAFRKAPNSREWYFPPQVDGLPENPLPPGPSTVWEWQQTDSPEQRERVANYFNAIRRLDDGIGMLVAALEKARLAENTLIIFLGDNGPPFDRGKTTCYEPGIRTPFLVRWPGVSKPGHSQALVSSVDILPTILDAAGVPVPAHVHGRSLRSVMGGGTASWRQYLAAEFHCHGAGNFFPRRAIRDGRWKLIRNLLAGKTRPMLGIDGDLGYKLSREARYDNTDIRRAFDTYANPPEYELYDLQADPHEFRNLAGKAEHAGVERRMKEALERWRKETKDPFLDPAYTEKVSRLTQTERAGDSWRPSW